MAAASTLRLITRAIPRPLVVRPASSSIFRPLAAVKATMSSSYATHDIHNPPKGGDPATPRRSPPPHPEDGDHTHYLGTKKRMPEFSLSDKVILVSGAARGLGLTQTEALLEAGATVYALDRLPDPSPDFYRVQKRAAEELQTTLYYRQIDVTDQEMLGEVVAKIGDQHRRIDGLIAAAGIQQETPALEYSAKDANKMFEVNITGVFMTAQAVAKEMIKHKTPGSMAFIASMSGTIANRVHISQYSPTLRPHPCKLHSPSFQEYRKHPVTARLT